jgi:hypothetical protein
MPPQQAKPVAGFGPPEDAPGFGPPEAAPVETGALRPLTETEQMETYYPVGERGETARENVHNFLRDLFTGAYGVIGHPLSTATSLISSIIPGTDTPNPIQSTYEGLNTRPGETIATSIGQGAVLGPVGKGAIEVGSRLVPKALRGGANIIAGTTPHEVAKLVKETREGNKAATETAAKANLDAAQKHLDETLDALHETEGREIQHAQDVKAAEEAAKAERKRALVEHSQAREKAIRERQEAEQRLIAEKVKQGKIGPAQARLQTAWSNLRAGIETARAKALKIGNEKYNAVNPVLAAEESDPEMFPNAVAQAAEALRGSKAEPTLLRAMERSIESGSVATYEDLQGDYSALGNELAKGTLPGDVYHAYDQLHEAIGDEMQRIADSKGLGAKVKDARNYWRRMKQTFGRPLTESDAATKALRASDTSLAAEEEQANRVRLLGAFDPDIPKLFNHIANLQKGVDALPKPVPERVLVEKTKAPQIPPRKPNLPPFEPNPVAPVTRVAPPDRPPEILAKTSTIGPEEMREAKGKGRQHRAGFVRHRANWVVTLPLLYALEHAVGGDVGAIGTGLKGAGAVLGTSYMLGRILENPRVVEFLIRPTPGDIAKVPPDLRANLGPILDAARRRGIRVNPALAMVAAASAPKQQNALPSNHPLSTAPLP